MNKNDKKDNLETFARAQLSTELNKSLSYDDLIDQVATMLVENNDLKPEMATDIAVRVSEGEDVDLKAVLEELGSKDSSDSKSGGLTDEDKKELQAELKESQTDDSKKDESGIEKENDSKPEEESVSENLLPDTDPSVKGLGFEILGSVKAFVPDDSQVIELAFDGKVFKAITENELKTMILNHVTLDKARSNIKEVVDRPPAKKTPVVNPAPYLKGNRKAKNFFDKVKLVN